MSESISIKKMGLIVLSFKAPYTLSTQFENDVAIVTPSEDPNNDEISMNLLIRFPKLCRK